MCVTCGCSDTESVTITDPATGEQRALSQAEHDRAHGAAHEHAHDAAGERAGEPRHHTYERVHTHDRHGLRAHSHSHPHVHSHDHTHGHDDAHHHAHSPMHDHDAAHSAENIAALHVNRPGTILALEQDILAKNQLLAERNRGWLAGREILALNLVSSPGSGKTALLERTLTDLKSELVISVIEGDQATANDAQRIGAAGCDVIQINTGTGCHLEADMLAHGLRQLNPPPGSVVMIENVGNLVCPALFDLGERAKVVILSVTEGEDKPIKYPHMFKASEVMLLNKIDLLPYLAFDVERCIAYARQVNPEIRVFRVSAQTGEGMSAWYGWLRGQAAARQTAS